MSLSIIECVPNFSEARRPEVVEAIVTAISSVPQVSVLDRHSDLDHNRTVITFVGPLQAVEEAAFRGIARAAELIDLNQHTGEHPRIGATDVVPFVPISGVSMEDCVELARRLGQRVGNELGIPVYLYEQAATRPERQNLENIRSGQYEILKKEIATRPERKPDFGPAQLGSAGATVIGARPFLIAYNVYLTSDDVTIAEKIAKVVRHSSGGLRYVKALGLLVDGRAQVSMNLTDFRKTPLARVVELIRREATRYGVAIHHSELVGLIPQDALIEAAIWYLQLDQFEAEQVLERRLSIPVNGAVQIAVKQLEAESGDQSGLDFLEALASAEPAPGGGSASAYTAAMAAALVAMVARLTIGRKKYAAVEGEMNEILERAEGLRAKLTQAVTEDAAAYKAVIAAFRLPKNTPEEVVNRSLEIEASTLQAAQVPLKVADLCVKVLELVIPVASHGNQNALSDAGTAGAMAAAALSGAGFNVRTNVASLQDQVTAQQLVVKLEELEDVAGNLLERIHSEITARKGFS